MRVSNSPIVIIGFVFFLLILLQCGREEETKQKVPIPKPADLTTMAEREKLLLIRHVPLGLTYAEVSEKISDLGPQRPEPGGSRLNLTDASLEVEILGLKTQLEFNFRDSTLYSYYYGPLIVSAETGDSLFEYLNSFYSEQYGEPDVEDAMDSPYFVKSRRWATSEYDVVLGNSIAHTKRIVGCGFQRPGVW